MFNSEKIRELKSEVRLLKALVENQTSEICGLYKLSESILNHLKLMIAPKKEQTITLKPKTPTSET